MKTLRLEISPRSAFGGAIKGDTLFGHLCWALRHRFGEARLKELLAVYGETPFAVCSDAFPTGHLPRPALPLQRFDAVDDDRKRIKKRQWLPLEAAALPVHQWLSYCRSEEELAPNGDAKAFTTHAQPHNSIHRVLGTTFGGDFAPFAQEQLWFRPDLHLDLWLVFDPLQLERGQVEECMEDIGRRGYGRDAAIGLGKFEIAVAEEMALPHHGEGNSYLTLAPCAPQGQGFDPAGSFYTPFTRFGRHGDLAVLMGRPFKNPLLLADTGALLAPRTMSHGAMVGRALGGREELSKVLPETVHQGYAPCVRVRLERGEG